MWGLKMQVFNSQKVLAVGQTSGSGGWVKKSVLITIKGNGLSIVFGNQKKEWANRPAPFEGASSNLDLSMVYPRKRKELLAYECVALMQLRISGQILCARQTKFSNRR